MRLAQDKVAKRIAQSTNNQSGVEAKSEEDSAAPSDEFQFGDQVRCTYSEDGVDYEAEVVAIVDEEQVVVKYVGYNNEETVETALLIPSWGKKARSEQIARANAQQEYATTGQTHHQAGRRSKKTSKYQSSHSFERYQTSLMIPPPPPLPPNFADSSEDSEHLSAMLMSWYMSGYYTGFYQGQKTSRKN